MLATIGARIREVRDGVINEAANLRRQVPVAGKNGVYRNRL
jgi:hypothetical protein